MKTISKKILYLLHQIQDLVIEVKDIQFYYQSNVFLLSVYILNEKKDGYKYNKRVYLDGFLSNENQVVKDLREIIKDLEAMKYENRGKSKVIS